MSRSIHETRRSCCRLRKFDFSNSAEKSEALRKAVGRLRKKRRIKHAVQSERGLSSPEGEPVSSSIVPIICSSPQEHVFDGASEGDVRGLLQTMPYAFTEGINSVRLCLGKEYLEESPEKYTTERDPIHNRLSIEVVPGLYCSPVLGTYAIKSGDISIYAYVWERQKTALIPSVVIEFYLLAQSLSVLVHEVAHHFDHARRIARGRWLSDRKENNEHYAEQREWDWTRQYVYPYLTSQYFKEWQEVKAWVSHHGGVEPTLDQLTDDPRNTMRDGLIRISVNITSAFHDLIKCVIAGDGLTASRLAYAWGLHYADHYEMCLEISRQLVLEEPANVEVLCLHADTLEHLNCFTEALEFVDLALKLNPSHIGALRTKANLMEDAKDWNALLEACHAWINAIPEGESIIFAYRTKAVALCALGRFCEMEAAIEASIQVRLKNDPKVRPAIRRLTFKRAGQELPDTQRKD